MNEDYLSFLNTLQQNHYIYLTEGNFKWFPLTSEKGEELFQASNLTGLFSSAKDFVYCINHNIDTQAKCPVCGSFVERNKSGYFKKYCEKEECRIQLLGKKLPSRQVKGVRKWNTEKLRETISSFHPEYDLSNTYYIGCFNRIKIGCPIHGEVEISTRSAIDGAGCKRCANAKNGVKTTQTSLSQEEFEKRAFEIHGTLIDLSRAIYKSNNVKVEVICNECGNSFLIRPSDLWAGHGCPLCKSSRGEKIISTILEEKSIPFEKEKTFEGLRYKLPLRFDFYLPTYNLCIEFNGSQHYSEKQLMYLMSRNKKELWNDPVFLERVHQAFEEGKIRDKLKEDFCSKKENPELLVIQDLRKIRETLNDHLK